MGILRWRNFVLGNTKLFHNLDCLMHEYCQRYHNGQSYEHHYFYVNTPLQGILAEIHDHLISTDPLVVQEQEAVENNETGIVAHDKQENELVDKETSQFGVNYHFSNTYPDQKIKLDCVTGYQTAMNEASDYFVKNDDERVQKVASVKLV